MTNWCGHVQGGFPNFCQSHGAPDFYECQNFCTGLDWCVGYSYLRGDDYCVLYLNTNSCPRGWTYERVGKVAQSASELKPYTKKSGGNCFAKKGKASKFIQLM